jgi:hypothetical protein
LSKNIGHLSLWKTKIYKQFQNGYFVYTDPDLLIHKDCPANFIEHFFKIMQRYRNAQKVGFGLAIDDLPDSYKYKDEVIAWEQQFWQNEIEKGIFLAGIDTTFAMYRPFVKGKVFVNNLRTGYPYIMHHLPWYADSTSLNEEDAYYNNSIATSTHWTQKCRTK